MEIFSVKMASKETGSISHVMWGARLQNMGQGCSYGEEKPQFVRKGYIWQMRSRLMRMRMRSLKVLMAVAVPYGSDPQNLWGSIL